MFFDCFDVPTHRALVGDQFGQTTQPRHAADGGRPFTVASAVVGQFLKFGQTSPHAKRVRPEASTTIQESYVGAETKLRAFQARFGWLVDPLLIPVALEVVIKPPPASRQNGLHDLDNVLRNYLIPRVVDILRPTQLPPSDSRRCERARYHYASWLRVIRVVGEVLERLERFSYRARYRISDGFILTSGSTPSELSIVRGIRMRLLAPPGQILRS
jgi:hypothetical protein